MAHQNFGQIIAAGKKGKSLFQGLGLSQHRGITFRTGERGTEKTKQIATGLPIQVAAAGDLKKLRRITGQTLQHLLMRLFYRRGFGRAAQFKLCFGKFVAPAGLLVMNDPVIDLGDRGHAPPDRSRHVGNTVFPARIPFQSFLQEEQIGFRCR